MRKSLKLVLALGVVGAFSPPLWGSPYQYEVGASFRNQDLGADSTKNVFSSAGAFYFEPVDSGRGPYAEAGFLHRKSNVQVGLSSGSYEDALRDIEQQTRLGLDYQFADSRFGVQVGLLNQDTELLQSQGNVESQRFEFGGSYYVMDGIRVSVALGREETTPSSPGVVFKNAETESTQVSVKGLSPLSNERYIAWQVFTETAETTVKNTAAALDRTKLGLAGSYFIDRTLSIGGGLTVANSDDLTADGQQLALTVEKYFTPTVALGFNFSNFEPSQNGADNIVAADLQLGLRF